MATRTASAVDVLPMIETLQRGVNNRLSVSRGTNTFRPITSAAHSNTATSDACFTDQHCTHWAGGGRVHRSGQCILLGLNVRPVSPCTPRRLVMYFFENPQREGFTVRLCAAHVCVRACAWLRSPLLCSCRAQHGNPRLRQRRS